MMLRLRFLLPSLPFVLPALMAGGQPAALLKLANGDRLSGVPSEINGDGHLLLTSAENLAGPGALRVSSLLDMRLPPTIQAPPAAGHQAVLTLTNGDTVRGQLTALDDTCVTLDSWYGGTLRIRRSMADGLEILRTEKTVYSGPDPLDNWTSYGNEGAWSFTDGRFVSSDEGGISREVDLPRKAHFSFRLSWRETLNFRVIFFASEGDNDMPDNCYNLICQRRFVYLSKRWMGNDQGRNPNIGRALNNIPNFRQNEKVQLDIYVDREIGTFTFYVDGKQSQVWTDPNPNVGSMGNWLHLVSENDPLQIDRIEASAWSGDLPEDSSAEPSDPPLQEEGQVIRLHNGDDLVGEVGGIEEGVLSLTTKHVDNIRVPVERMRSIDLSLGSDGREEPIRRKGDIRAWLRDGGHITFRLDSFKDGMITGTSQTFGTAEFDLSAFSRLDFNIYQEDLEALREPANW